MNALAQPVLLLDREDFEYFRTKIFQLAGISLSEVKRDLVQTRLRSRIIALKLESFSHYVSHLEALAPSDPEWEVFTNLLTTNKTDWFREPEHFDFIVESFLPKWLGLKKKHLKVWCAASSTGEEPYTLSMVLQRALQGSGLTFSIHATDLDTKVLGVAQNGVFARERLNQVPPEYQDAFALGTGEIRQWMKLKTEFKKAVTFEQFNLVTGDYGSRETFDLILCRNVLIYFNPETIHQVVESLFTRGCDDSVLLISHSESLQSQRTSWKFHRPSIYTKGRLF